MIVKIQVPIFSSEADAPALVYNEDRSVIFQTEVTKEIKKHMGTSYKKYFDIDFDLSTVSIAKIKKEVRAQAW